MRSNEPKRQISEGGLPESGESTEISIKRLRNQIPARVTPLFPIFHSRVVGGHRVQSFRQGKQTNKNKTKKQTNKQDKNGLE